MSGGRLRKREKLMEKTDYVRVLRKGRRFSSRNFSVATAENGFGFARIGQIVAKKNVPSAVSRNKIKRRFREVFRLNKQRFGSNDVVFMAKNDSSNLPFPAVSGELLGLVGGEN
ncbi:MAG: ribonuclease P protein component [Candidatus Dadabacteria bacterium]|nr:ribonuclease P protein component [Candidatus Dadabacteria bacterium]MCY4043372.1 ribonuclease P protein component [Candidatus Dadabacteria bacterium]MCY4046847.1 ribonuclease P protein component [Candidatus Dadabacteria bacterium]